MRGREVSESLIWSEMVVRRAVYIVNVMMYIWGKEKHYSVGRYIPRPLHMVSPRNGS